MIEVKPGDVFHGLCCPGYDFTIATIIVSAWGHCDGPHSGDEDDPYRQVNQFEIEDIELFTAEQGKCVNKVPCPSCTFRGPVWIDENNHCVHCEEVWAQDGTGWAWVWDIVPWEWWIEYGMITRDELLPGSLTMVLGAGGEIVEPNA